MSMYMFVRRPNSSEDSVTANQNQMGINHYTNVLAQLNSNSSKDEVNQK